MADRIHRYEGEAIEVTWDKDRCIHYAACIRRLPSVFHPARRPWVAPDAAPATDVVDAVLACPTGALQYVPRPGQAAEAPDGVNTVVVRPHGPLFVRGDVALAAPDGRIVSRETRLALCRCGSSAYKPLCDNGHVGAAFRDGGPPAEGGADDAVGTGTVTIEPEPDGPNLWRGPLEIRTAAGRTIARAERGALCRCGQSARKPFCDGSHARVGFRAPGIGDGA